MWVICINSRILYCLSIIIRFQNLMRSFTIVEHGGGGGGGQQEFAILVSSVQNCELTSWLCSPRKL